MKHVFIFFITSIFFALPKLALANVPYDYNYFTLKDFEIKQIDEGEMTDSEMSSYPFAYDGNCSGKRKDKPNDESTIPGKQATAPLPVKPNRPGTGSPILPKIPGIPGKPKIPGTGIPGAGGVAGDLTKIINIGKMIWNIIESNQPISSITTERAYAMPEGITCWTSLENWSRPSSRSYQISYKNLYGSTVASLKMKVIYYHSGQLNGKGAFLANVTVVPKNVTVKWGFKLNAQVITEEPINLASKDNPVAGMGIGIIWKIESVMQDKIQSLDLFVDGLGNLEQI